jgi:hypothetical protein
VAPRSLRPDLPADQLIRALHSLRDVSDLQDCQAALPLLSHAEADVRVAALDLIFVHWKAEQHRESAIALLLRDPAEEVRAAGAYALVATSSDESRAGDTKLLLDALTRDSAEVKRAAYEGLLLLYRRPDFPDSLTNFDPDTAIDWEWIQEIKLLSSES